MGLSFMWSDWYMTIACVLLWVPLVLLPAFLVKCFYNNKPIIRRVKVAPKQSPYKVATEGIERIRAEKSWQKESPKAYYTDLTDVVRTYIKNRFGFDALEMTSAQIIEALQQTHDRDALRDLTDLFLTADLVKFAKHTPLMNENDANLLVALNFINDTKEVEAVDAKPEPTEITVVEKRPLRTKLLLGGAILLLVAALIVLSMCAATEIYGYFF